jgi:hypothetical protein
MRSVSMLLVMAICAACVPLPAQVVFNGSASNLRSIKSTDAVRLVGSSLSDVQELTAHRFADVAGNQGSGSVQKKSSTSGAIVTGASFDGDRSFTIRYTNGSIFTGSLASGAPRGKPLGSFVFQDTVNGMLTGPGYAPWMVVGGPVDLTATGINCAGECRATNGGALSTFAAAPTLSAVPELGTLTLVGSGLVSLGVFARRRLKRNPS